MKCRKGELAFIVNGTGDVGPQFIGKVVRCVEPFAADYWHIRSEGTPFDWLDGRTCPDAACADANLKPLRGKPEDEEIRDLEPHELEAASVTTASGMSLWPT